MKSKLLKYFFIGVGVLVVLAAGLLAYIYFSFPPTGKLPSDLKLTVESTPEKVQKGKKLASMLCIHCHSDPTTRQFTGRMMAEADDFGKIYAPNITQHPNAKGMGVYSDAELIYLLRTGIKRDGKFCPPPMAKLPHTSDDDLQAIVAFLKSDDPMVQPADVSQPATEYNFLVRFLSFIGAVRPFPYPSQPVPMPDTADAVALGKYLVFTYECFSCHSADFTKNDYFNPEKSLGYCGGGNKIKDATGNVILTSNLTFHETGIKNWTEAEFINAVKYAKRPDGSPIAPPMLPYAALEDKEVKAIFAYLKTIPPIDNLVKK